MRSVLSAFCLITMSFTAIGQGLHPFSIEKIIPGLQQDANVVIRQENNIFRVHSPSKAQLEVQKVMTIMNEEGNSAVPFYLYYDSHRQLKSLSATVFDAEGRQTAQINADEFGDYPAVQDAPLLEHNRFKVYAHNTDHYPFTIAFHYTIDIEGLYRYPNWSPVKAEGIAVQEATFQLIIPDSLRFHYQSYQLDEGPEIVAGQKEKTYTWQVRNQKPVRVEPLGPEFYEITPTLQLFPESFSYDGVAGSAESWDRFGSWVNQFLRSDDSVSDTTRDEILKLVEHTSEIRQKIRLIRDYVHTRSRYVHLPLGIGTYQPMGLAQFEKAGYGDSKAFTYYMQSLLEIAGIRSHYALVNGGKFATDVEKGLPGAQFNQAILAVPLAGDTLWLDCTDPYRPVGYPGYLLSDRDVLIITEEGGRLVRTPTYSAHENLQARHASIQLSEEGHASAEVVTRFSGLQYAHISPVLLLSSGQQEEVIYRKTPLSSFHLESYSYYGRADESPHIEEKLIINLEDFGKSSADRMYFNPNLMNQMDGLPPLQDERKYDVKIKREFLDVDTLWYTLPESMKVLSLPEEIRIQSEFGEYRMAVRQDGKQLQYTRYLQTNKGSFTAESYADLQKFYEDVVRADQRKVILEQIGQDREKEELSRTSRLQ